MFSDVYDTKDSTSILEERKLLQQITSLGVAYSRGRPWFSKAASSDAYMLYALISRAFGSQKYSDEDDIIQEIKGHKLSKEDGYYLLDLHNGRILGKGQYFIEDAIIDLTLLNTDNRVQLRRRKRTCIHNTSFLIAPNTVYFLWMDSVYNPFKEFHMLSFIRLEDDSRLGFVIDYDATQNNRPLILFPYEENNEIIQSQLDHDDQRSIEEYEELLRDIRSYEKNRREIICSSTNIAVRKLVLKNKRKL